MSNDAKERILAAALEMFSQYGSAETNFRAERVAWACKSGLYKHFESKEAMKRIMRRSAAISSAYTEIQRGKIKIVGERCLTLTLWQVLDLR